MTAIPTSRGQIHHLCRQLPFWHRERPCLLAECGRCHRVAAGARAPRPPAVPARPRGIENPWAVLPKWAEVVSVSSAPQGPGTPVQHRGCSPLVSSVEFPGDWKLGTARLPLSPPVLSPALQGLFAHARCWSHPHSRTPSTRSPTQYTPICPLPVPYLWSQMACLPTSGIPQGRGWAARCLETE